MMKMDIRSNKPITKEEPIMKCSCSLSRPSCFIAMVFVIVAVLVLSGVLNIEALSELSKIQHFKSQSIPAV